MDHDVFVSSDTRCSYQDDPAQYIAKAFDVIAAATLARHGADAQRLGFLKPHDRIVATNPLEAAIRVASTMNATEPPAVPENPVFGVAGSELLGELRATQQRKLDGGEITPHQLEVNMRIAEVLCGGAGEGTPCCPESRRSRGGALPSRGKFLPRERHAVRHSDVRAG